jgi:hypothetical protein
MYTAAAEAAASVIGPTADAIDVMHKTRSLIWTQRCG